MESLKLDDGDKLPPTDQLQQLTSLECAEGAWWYWEQLAGLPALEQLEIHGEGVYDLDDMPVLPRLRGLTVTSCPHLADVSALGRQPALEELSLGCVWATARADLDPLTHSTLAAASGLRWLKLTGWPALTDLSFAAGMTALEHLDVRFCARLASLAGLEGCTRLRHLNLNGCTAFADLDALVGADRLAHVHLSQCRSLDDVSPLAALPALRTVTLNDMPVPRGLDLLKARPEVTIIR